MVLYRYFLIVFLFSSCATLFNDEKVTINVTSDIDSLLFYVNNDTTHQYITPIEISTLRSKDSLLITAIHKSIEKKYLIDSQLSNRYIFGNLYGIYGYGIDLFSQKRFTYPTYLNLHFNEKIHRSSNFSTWKPPKKGQLNLRFTIPEGNHFYLNKGEYYGSSAGFLGISGALEYFYTSSYFLSLNIGAILDFMIPLPAPLNYPDSYDRSQAIFWDIKVGSEGEFLYYAAGIQANKTEYYEFKTIGTFPDSTVSTDFSKVQHNFGLAFSGSYKFSNQFSLGLNYYPSLFVLNSKNISYHYSHLIFFEFQYRFELFTL